MNKKYTTSGLFIIILLLLINITKAQQTDFSKGVNLTLWFQWHTDTDMRGGMQANRYTKQDFRNIKSLGCDVIRIPIKLHSMVQDTPAYKIDPLFFNLMDHAVKWAEDLDMHLIIDNHSFDPQAATQTTIEDTLMHIWPQIAQHYKDHSDLIIYEILNEPHGIGLDEWNAIQGRVVDTIRDIDQKHSIIVSPAEFSSVENLSTMPAYDYDNLIYNFHFYEPFIFTHQGASWTDPSLDSLSGMPFPYQADSMPELPSSLEGTWLENSYNNYDQEGTIQRLKERLNQVVEFRENRNVPVFCGEMGVYIPNSPSHDRVVWYDSVQNYFQRHQIAYTSWDYHGGFGLFESDSYAQSFDHHLNVPLLEAMDMQVPEQTPFVKQPDSSGFIIYDDFLGKNIEFNDYSDGNVSMYENHQPYRGDYCMTWGNAGQYQYLYFDFLRTRDLSYLEADNYYLDMMVKCNIDTAAVEVRFVDTDTGESDHPWRARTVIDNAVMPMDGNWHNVHIPLSEFTDIGAYEDDTWYPSEGEFDWSAIDNFKIDAFKSLDGIKFWFDDIRVTKENTGCEGMNYSITYEDSILRANTADASYQWLKCENAYTPVDGATSRSYQPRGETYGYAVEITKDGCTDTTMCFDVTGINMSQWGFGDDCNAWPNPVSTRLWVDLGKTYSEVQTTLFSSTGNRVKKAGFNTTDQFTIPLKGLPAGMYLLHIQTASGNHARLRVMKE